jgi:hypothetical protein
MLHPVSALIIDYFLLARQWEGWKWPGLLWSRPTSQGLIAPLVPARPGVYTESTGWYVLVRWEIGMDAKPPESGFDELMRLSQQFTRQQHENIQKERRREEQGKKVRGVLQGLKELNLSTAIEQLRPVATPEIIEKVNALRRQPGTEDLRQAISTLADGLEKSIAALSVANPDTAPLIRTMKTLNILMDLYFSLH